MKQNIAVLLESAIERKFKKEESRLLPIISVDGVKTISQVGSPNRPAESYREMEHYRRNGHICYKL